MFRFRHMPNSPGVLFTLNQYKTAIDTVSNVFAVIDGVTQLDGQDGDCSLTCGSDQLSGALQDHFLEHCEE